MGGFFGGNRETMAKHKDELKKLEEKLIEEEEKLKLKADV